MSLLGCAKLGGVSASVTGHFYANVNFYTDTALLINTVCDKLLFTTFIILTFLRSPESAAGRQQRRFSLKLTLC